MPRFDFQCPVCGSLKQDVYIDSSQDHMPPERMCECGAWREKLPAAPNFTVKGFNARNGYSK